MVDGSNCIVFTTFPMLIFSESATMVAASSLQPGYTWPMALGIRIPLLKEWDPSGRVPRRGVFERDSPKQ